MQPLYQESPSLCFVVVCYLCKPYVLTFVAITPLSVQQAVGSAESKCREEGNCLEKGELDGGTYKKHI